MPTNNAKPADAKPARKPRAPRKPAAKPETAAPAAAPAAEAPAAEAPAFDRDAARTAALSIYRAAGGTGASIPVKPVRDFKPTRVVSAHTGKPTERAARAVCIAFAQAGVPLADGASAPRFFDFDGERYCIENGGLKRAITGGLVTVAGDVSDTITLRPGAVAAITTQLGARAIADLLPKA